MCRPAPHPPSMLTPAVEAGITMHQPLPLCQPHPCHLAGARAACRTNYSPRPPPVQGCMLALVAGASKVYLWTPGGASIVHVPLAHFHAHALTWSPRGSGFALTDKDAFCCAYLAGGGA